MELIEEVADDVTIVGVTGRLDTTSARQLGERLISLIQSGQSRLLIEASKLDYIGSQGIRALLVAARRAADSRGRVVLCGMGAPVRRVVELGGFGDNLESFTSREDALDSFRAEA